MFGSPVACHHEFMRWRWPWRRTARVREEADPGQFPRLVGGYTSGGPMVTPPDPEPSGPDAPASGE